MSGYCVFQGEEAYWNVIKRINLKSLTMDNNVCLAFLAEYIPHFQLLQTSSSFRRVDVSQGQTYAI
jgi:hypothetical protein